MKQRFGGTFLACAAALALCACAATGPGGSDGTAAAKATVPASVTTAPNNSPKAIGNYMRVQRNGRTLYCQKDLDTATRMVQETCLTQAQAEAQQENARNFMQGAQGMATTVPGPNTH
jgi:hypothetical protein